MAIVALVLWAFTVAVGVYLLASSTRLKPEAAEETATSHPARDNAAPATGRNQFDPPSLRAAKSEPLPGLRALGEFTHPALAIIGFGFWLLYTVAHDQIFAAIAVGVIGGTIVAGLSFAATNGRAVKKADGGALSFSGRVLACHVAGAALTLLVVLVTTMHIKLHFASHV